MEWTSLLSTEKLAVEPEEPAVFRVYPINAFEKDYRKIVSSAAFRRLQDKTQVFPLDKSDFVRTRLTHSIEVSTIARQLGIMISKNTTQYQQIAPENAEGIASVLLCAGLLHDLGNPPFGHFGETVIGEHSVVGGNAFLTGSVADNTRVVITAPETVFKNAE